MTEYMDFFGDYGLSTTLFFLLGLGIGVLVFVIFYLVLILKTSDEKQIVKPEREVSKEEIVGIIKKYHAKIDSYSKESSMKFDKTKQVTANLVGTPKSITKEIADAFYPSSKNSLMQLSIDELLMTNREIIRDAEMIISNLDGSVISDINDIIKHANNVVSKFGYNLSGRLELNSLTIGDLLDIKAYMQKNIKFEKIDGIDKEGMLKTATTVLKNRGFIKETVGEISNICLNYGIDISAEVKKIGSSFRDELSEATEGGLLKTVGGAIKSVVTTKPSATIRKVKKTVVDSTKKVLFLSADEILSSQLANVYKDMVSIIGIEVYSIYSKQLFTGKSISKIELQTLLENNQELTTEVKLTLKKQLTVN